MHVTSTLRTRSIALLTAVALTSSAIPAFADKKECAHSYVEGQKAMRANALRKAREHLRICARDECLAAVRRDCIGWLDEVNASIPTIVVEAKDPDGKETFDVRVSSDNQVIVNKLDGHPIELDPGMLKMRFERVGSPPVEEQVVLNAGQRNKVVSVTFVDPSRPRALQVVPPQAEEKKSSRVLPLALGGAALVAIGGAAFFWVSSESKRDDLESASCAPQCNPDDVDGVRRDRIVGDVLLGVGLVSAGVAITLLLTSSSSSKTQAKLPTFWTQSGRAGATFAF